MTAVWSGFLKQSTGCLVNQVRLGAVMYAYPTDFTDEMIDAIADCRTSSSTSIFHCSTYPV